MQRGPQPAAKSRASSPQPAAKSRASMRVRRPTTHRADALCVVPLQDPPQAVLKNSRLPVKNFILRDVTLRYCSDSKQQFDG